MFASLKISVWTKHSSLLAAKLQNSKLDFKKLAWFLIF